MGTGEHREFNPGCIRCLLSTVLTSTGQGCTDTVLKTSTRPVLDGTPVLGCRTLRVPYYLLPQSVCPYSVPVPMTCYATTCGFIVWLVLCCCLRWLRTLDSYCREQLSRASTALLMNLSSNTQNHMPCRIPSCRSRRTVRKMPRPSTTSQALCFKMAQLTHM